MLTTALRPAQGGFAITPNDSANLTQTTRWLIVGTAGDVKVDFADGTAAVVLKAVPVGVHPLAVKKVFATGTTAQNLSGLY